MLIKPDEAVARLNNPLNLLNRMKNGLNGGKRAEAMSLFIRPSEVAKKVEAVKETIPTFTNPFENKTPKLEQLVEESDKQIALATAHDEALGLLNDSLKAARLNIDSLDTDKLPSMITSASKVVESIRKERNEVSKNRKGQDVHYHFYTPLQRKVEEYEVIDVG